MNDDQPTQPLTGDEESLIREWHNKTRDPKLGRALAEVDRLRAENHGVTDENSALLRKLEEQYRLRAENARLRKQVQDYHESADAHAAKFERQHERLMEAQQEVRELRSLIHPQDPAPCARLHDTDPKSAHVALNTVPMCFLSNAHEANHRCLCGKEW